MTQTILNTPALAVEFMRHVAPDGVTVDSGVTPDIVARMPIAVVTTTAPRAVPNDSSSWLPSCLGGGIRPTELCNYFFWVRRPW